MRWAYYLQPIFLCKQACTVGVISDPHLALLQVVAGQVWYKHNTNELREENQHQNCKYLDNHYGSQYDSICLNADHHLRLRVALLIDVVHQLKISVARLRPPREIFVCLMQALPGKWDTLLHLWSLHSMDNFL